MLPWIDCIPQKEIWCVDFEFCGGPGERPIPVCLVARELKTNRVVRLWQDELSKVPPYPTDSNSLFVAFYASAEIGCHLALSWPKPRCILDLFTEFRNLTNGLPTVTGSGLLDALAYFGLDGIESAAKQGMREMILTGGPWSTAEKIQILDYCATDVDALALLLPKMLPYIEPGALLRGRYMAAAAEMEFCGVPIDTETFRRLSRNWEAIQRRLIQKIDQEYEVYEGRTFKRDKFEAWLTRENIPWPRLPSCELDLADKTFKNMALTYPQIEALRQLRKILSQLRLTDIEVGRDGRNRCLLSAFRAKTSRNQPSNSKFIFGASSWLRGLIRPPQGFAIVYIDFEQQEFGIAAALSGDPRMIEAYQTGDPYLSFAKLAGAVPGNATKHSHARERELYKTCALAVQYGMTEKSLAQRISQPVIVARNLIRTHKELFRRYWEWNEQILNSAYLTLSTSTVFGWKCDINPYTNARSVSNFPIQSNGAEMLRLACCMATEQGLQIGAPVHDALLLVAPLDEVDDQVEELQEIMCESSRIILNGFPIRTEAAIIRHPDRYLDKRGSNMWDGILQILEEVEGESGH